MSSSHSKIYDDMYVIVRREHLIQGKAADKRWCAIKIAMMTVFGETVDWSALTVGVNNGSLTSEATIWAAWDSVDEQTHRMRHFTAGYISPVNPRYPRDLAYTVV